MVRRRKPKSTKSNAQTHGKPARKSGYKVLIDDNFHFMDTSYRVTHGEFATYEEAVAACKRIIDSDLEQWAKGGATAKELWETWAHFGEDPFIVRDPSTESTGDFRAYVYVRERCRALAKRK